MHPAIHVKRLAALAAFCAASLGARAETIAADVARRDVDLVIALDVSGSMEGLIDSAKQRLWDITNELAQARPVPALRVAILSYGSPSYGEQAGFVRVDLPFTADLDAEVTAWRTRPLAPTWPIVYFDGIVVHVRGANGHVSQHTVYVALGVNLEGHKELIGLWLGESEGAKFWLGCLTDLKNRGLSDIFVACIDGLSGFAEAIHAAYPQAKVQLCIVHLVRAALRYVSSQDSKAVIADLKKIYQAATVVEAEQALDAFAKAWNAKYPTIAKMWRAKWTNIITLFDYPPAIRHVIYTTNAIESVNSVIRKFTRNRKIYPNEESALKNVYMAIREASRRWTMPIHHWKQALNHFAILYEGRMPIAN